MFRVLQILNAAEVAECQQIAASAPFVDGRITNPHNQAKVNEQLHDADAYQKSSAASAGRARAKPGVRWSSPSRSASRRR